MYYLHLTDSFEIWLIIAMTPSITCSFAGRGALAHRPAALRARGACVPLLCGSCPLSAREACRCALHVGRIAASFNEGGPLSRFPVRDICSLTHDSLANMDRQHESIAYSNWSFWALLLSCGLVLGVLPSWATLIVIILRPHGVSQATVGQVSTATLALCCLATLVFARCAHRTRELTLPRVSFRLGLQACIRSFCTSTFISHDQLMCLVLRVCCAGAWSSRFSCSWRSALPHSYCSVFFLLGSCRWITVGLQNRYTINNRYSFRTN